MPEHGDKSWIDIEESSTNRASANAEGRAQDQRAGASLGAAQCFFIAFVLDGCSQLLRNKLQDFAVALAETCILTVTLDHKDTDASGAAFERNAEPVDGSRADQLHFAAAHQIVKHGRGCKQGLAGSQDVFRNTASAGL